MKKRYEYLKDTDFLKELDSAHLKEQYAKITVLDWLENPIQDIQGIVTGGSINIDGNSSMRRTCSLSVYVHEDNYARVTNVDNLISMNKKIDLEIGIKNTTKKYSQYPIIWFPQGIFVIVNPSISHGTNGTNISITCKDKMCLLNGEVGGIIPASTQFDEYETIDEEGNWIITKPTIILADEPTGNLDSKSSDEIVTLLKKSNKDLKQTIIMITHNMEIAKYADRIIKIEDGKIVEEV